MHITAVLGRTVIVLLGVALMMTVALEGRADVSAESPVEPASSVGDLFHPIAPPTAGRAPGHRASARARYVGISLDRIAGPGVGDGAAGSVRDTIHLSLFDGSRMNAARTGLDIAADGSYIWHGEAAGPAGGQVTLSVREDAVAGTIIHAGKTYQLMHVAGGVHELMELDPALLPDSLEPLVPSEPSKVDDSSFTDGRTRANAKAGHQSVDGIETVLADPANAIDIMVVYTPAARAAQGGTAAIEALIALAVIETNQAYSNSGIDLSITLAHVAEVDYTESGSFETDLIRLQDPDDRYLKDVPTLRDAHNADLVSMITNSAGSCGLAFLMQSVSRNFADYGYSVVARTCATGNFSFGHELGHNQGSQHDRSNATSAGAYQDSFGYQSPGQTFRTIMAYNCPSGCPRLQHFSNPAVEVEGEPTGVDLLLDPPNSADNHRSIEATAATVANFRMSTPPTPPAAPSGLTAKTVDGSTILLAWSDNADDEKGARIERSWDGGTTWKVVTTVSVNAQGFVDRGLPRQATYMYRVSAFNDGGDSPHTNVAAGTTDATPAPIDRVSSGEESIMSSVVFTHAATHADDTTEQVIYEVDGKGRPADRINSLDHRWTIDVAPGETITLMADARAGASLDGDTFRFEYDAGSGWVEAFTITRSTPTGYVSAPLPPGTSGLIVIRVVDTDRTPGNTGLDWVFVDHLLVRSEVSADAPATLAANGFKTKGLQSVDLTWFGAPGSGVDVWRDGAIIATVENTGSYTDAISAKSGGPYQYRVCKASTSICSNEVQVTV